MSDLILNASTRTMLGKKTKSIRSSGHIPAVLYGHGVASKPLTVSAGDFSRIFKKAGESTLLDLVVDDNAPTKVIVKDVQRHPLTNAIIHADLHQVKMTEKLRAEIVLRFTGESAAVKELGGVLVKSLDHVKVETLPADLVPEIAVDISMLRTFDDLIHVKDLAVPKGITVLDNKNEVVALVTPPRSEEELASLGKEAVDEKAAVENIEGIKEEKKEGDENADTEEGKADEKKPADTDKKSSKK